jgi:hypothetical protein
MLKYDVFLKLVRIGLRRGSLRPSSWFSIASKKNWEYLYEYAARNYTSDHARLALILCPKEKDKDKKTVILYNEISGIHKEISDFNKMITTLSLRETIVRVHFDLWKNGVYRLNPEYEKIINKELGLVR